ncbi:nucleotide exchange factor GrpE [Streptomyces virginiae]|uniref:nucleotide exchange factor GrpE n=1 Tax=Streptomyces virginiae TaxID=1961 RepID=UPI002251B7D7|nr:nucleotide exchange factor GrpE [Streptomyces virginiae]MCX5274383.1 nucleotide exchange factor GrpE [Streptomyces virginiae]
MTGPDPLPGGHNGPPSELDKLRRRVAALSAKRVAAEDKVDALLTSLLSLDDALADTRRRAGALHEARSARETASAALALCDQIEGAHLMLRAEFARHDVDPVDAVGRAADPAEMRVVGTEPHPSLPGGTVVREKVTGFRRGSALLRAAQVVVAVPGPAPEPVPGPVLDPVLDPVQEPDPVPGPATGRKLTQPRRTTRAQRRLPRKPSAGRGRRSRRA